MRGMNMVWNLMLMLIRRVGFVCLRITIGVVHRQGLILAVDERLRLRRIDDRRGVCKRVEEHRLESFVQRILGII
jgi:hypothetical protein